VDFAGGDKVAGKKFKARSGWDGISGNGTDIYGFAALPGGYGNSDGYFRGAGDYGIWWSSSEHSADDAYYRNMSYSSEYVLRGNYYKSVLRSVRCLQD